MRICENKTGIYLRRQTNIIQTKRLFQEIKQQELIKGLAGLSLISDTQLAPKQVNLLNLNKVLEIFILSVVLLK